MRGAHEKGSARHVNNGVDRHAAERASRGDRYDGPRGVLLVHGFGDTPQTLRYLADNLHAHGYDVRVPLLPGHGRSVSSFDSTPHTAWLDAVRAELLAMRARVPWVALGGLSMGGALSAIVAAETPKECRSTMVFEPTGSREAT